MTRGRRRNHNSAVKAKIALAAYKGEHAVAELAEQFDVHPNRIQDWKKRLLPPASLSFELELPAVNVVGVLLQGHPDVNER